jgi:para-aminobenzoate synthetase
MPWLPEFVQGIRRGGLLCALTVRVADYELQIEKLNMPRHGMVNPVLHNATDIFRDIGEFKVTSYHSLRVKTRLLALNGCAEAALPGLWVSDENYPTIKPLAWDVSDRLNGPVLMGARHTEKPFWGVQYHPESICTTEEGRRVVSGWWREASIWTRSHPRKVIREPVPHPERKDIVDGFRQKSVSLAAEHASRLRDLGLLDFGDRVIWKSIWAPTLDAQEVSRLLCSPGNEAVILQSGKQNNGQPVDEQLGRYSIISVLDPAATIRFQYDVASCTISVTGTADFDGTTSYPAVVLSSTVDDVFSYLKEIMLQLQCQDGPDTIPFWGGLMGYVSYEAGLETISVNPGHTMSSTAGGAARPDINFVLITRSVVIDHFHGYAVHFEG